MLVDVGHHGLLQHLSLRVLADDLSNLRVLHSKHVNLDVGLVVLLDECLDGLALEDVLVLLNRIDRGHVVFNRHQLGGVLDAKNLQHLAVQQRHVVQLGRSLGQLQDGLILDDLLRHGGGVGVAHRNDVDIVVVRLAGHRAALFGLVRVLLGRVVSDDVFQELELLLHAEMHARLNRAHHLELALQQGQRRTNGGVGRHIADVHVAAGSKGATFLDDLLEQDVQGLARLLIGQRQDVVADRTRRNIYISELAGSDWGVIAFDSKAPRFETTGEVRQSASINKLPDKHSRALGIPTDEVDEAIAIKAKPGYVLIMYEVLSFEMKFVAFIPVPSDCQNFAGALFDRDDVGQGDAGDFAAFVGVFKALEVKVDVHLQDAIALVLDG